MPHCYYCIKWILNYFCRPDSGGLDFSWPFSSATSFLMPILTIIPLVVCTRQYVSSSAGSLERLRAQQRRSGCPTQGLDLISDLLVSFSLRLRWPACQGDAGNVFPPIMCVFNTSGAKSRRRFVKWKSALNLTGGHALISLLHTRMEGETVELVCVHEEIVQINTLVH